MGLRDAFSHVRQIFENTGKMTLLALWSGLLAVIAQSAAQDYGSSPPVYPSPPTAGIGWEAAFAQAEAFVSNLTLEEKAQMVTGTSGPCVGNIGGIPRIGFDGICMQDGPLAIRQATYASVFPAGLTAASSWDRGLIFARGLYMGAEFKGKGSHVALGPVVGPLGRSGYGGRVWEGFSPDPYLTGVAAEQTIWGMQQAGVQTSLKHYIGNEQETQRNPDKSANGTTIEAVSSNIDDRTMHELYLWPFANGVRAGTASIMCSYNRLNGSYGCQNSKTINGLLKTELGFQGYVVSDWQATHAGVDAINAGLDMDMPGESTFPINIYKNPDCSRTHKRIPECFVFRR
jgi:beta-glucosidase